MNENVACLLRVQALERPDSAAIIEAHGRGRVITFAELALHASGCAQALHQDGIGAGDAVLIVHGMSIELYAALTAILQLGAVAMFIDPSADAHVIAACCALQPPAAFFGSGGAQLLRWRFPALRSIKRRYSTGALWGATRWRRASDEHALPVTEEFGSISAVQPDAPALMTFTSGSTGQPKAAVRSHFLLRAQLQRLQENLSLTAGAIDLTTLPIVLLANLACGVTSVISAADLRRPGAVDGSRVFADAQQHAVTTACASPALFERLADYCERENVQLPLLRKVACGGAPVFPRTLDCIARFAPHARVTAIYGSTEAEPIADIARDDISAADRQAMREGAGLIAGVPVNGIRAAIIADKWGQPLGPLSQTDFEQLKRVQGEAGEIVVSGDHVLPGYLHGRGDEETKFKVDGVIWHRTGDMGYFDPRGRLWLLGRCNAKVADPKGTLYPFAVECAASHYATVRRSALVSDATRRILVIEPAQAAPNLDELNDIVSWANIDSVRLVPRIPVDRRHNAKVDYPALRRMLKL